MPRSGWLPRLCGETAVWRHGWGQSHSVRACPAGRGCATRCKAAVWQNSVALETSPGRQTGPSNAQFGTCMCLERLWRSGQGRDEASPGTGMPGCPAPASARLAAPPAPSGAGSAPAPFLRPAGGSGVSPWISAWLGQGRRTARTLKALGHARRMSLPSRKSSSSWTLGGPLAITLMKYGLISS